MTRTPPSYVRLFNLLRAIRELPPFSALTADEELMLEDLIVHWHERGLVKMSELLDSGAYPSRSTAYRRIVGLHDKGIILVDRDPNDRRERNIRPSDAAKSYIAQVQSGVENLLQSR